MLLNILHQLLKGMVEDIYMLQCLKNIVKVKFKGVCVKMGRIKSFNQANRTVFLDEKFCYLFLYPTLKLFKKYSKVK